MSKAADISLDSILPAPHTGPAPIEAQDDNPVIEPGTLLVAGRGDVVMGSPTNFERAG